MGKIFEEVLLNPMQQISVEYFSEYQGTIQDISIFIRFLIFLPRASFGTPMAQAGLFYNGKFLPTLLFGKIAHFT